MSVRELQCRCASFNGQRFGRSLPCSSTPETTRRCVDSGWPQPSRATPSSSAVGRSCPFPIETRILCGNHVERAALAGHPRHIRTVMVRRRVARRDRQAVTSTFETTNDICIEFEYPSMSFRPRPHVRLHRADARSTKASKARPS